MHAGPVRRSLPFVAVPVPALVDWQLYEWFTLSLHFAGSSSVHNDLLTSEVAQLGYRCCGVHCLEGRLASPLELSKAALLP
jgi:hypothetical protein